MDDKPAEKKGVSLMQRDFMNVKKLILNIFLIGIAWVAIIFGSRAYFKSYTHHGEKVEVPNLLDNNMKDISTLIGDKKLQYEILDSIYNPDLVEGTVIYQNPMPTDSTGVMVKEGRIIKVRVSKRSRLVSVPFVVDKSERFAEAVLMSKSLRTKIKYVPRTEAQGAVIEQEFGGKPMTAGQQVPINSVILLTVGRRSGESTVSVPNLIGLTINEAQERFKSNSLRLYSVCNDCVTASDSLNARVIRQTPVTGDSSRVPEGTTITIFASTKNEPIDEPNNDED